MLGLQSPPHDVSQSLTNVGVWIWMVKSPAWLLTPSTVLSMPYQPHWKVEPWAHSWAMSSRTASQTFAMSAPASTQVAVVFGVTDAYEM